MDLLRGKATALGATVYAINGMPDHVHLVAAVPPNLSLASFIGQVKGSCSTRVNKSGAHDRFQWQDEYAAFSFDAKRLPPIVAYVDNQKTHHAQSGLTPRPRTPGIAPHGLPRPLLEAAFEGALRRSPGIHARAGGRPARTHDEHDQGGRLPRAAKLFYPEAAPAARFPVPMFPTPATDAEAIP
jgi:Transposase and inactivated derivatives